MPDTNAERLDGFERLVEQIQDITEKSQGPIKSLTPVQQPLETLEENYVIIYRGCQRRPDAGGIVQWFFCQYAGA